MSALFVILAILCLVGLGVRSGYELLKRAGKVDTQSKLVFGIVFAAMILFLLSWPFMCPRDPLPFGLPASVRWAGLVVAVTGLGLALGGLLQLRGLENIDHLVKDGLYAKLRHPMYTGFMLWILGWVVFYAAGVSLVVGIVAVGNILFWRMLEEEKLGAEWGEEYRKYKGESWF